MATIGTIGNPTDEAFVRAVEATLVAEVRSTLKAPLMKQAELMVDAAVDSAVKSLQPRIEAWINERYRTLDVRVLVSREGHTDRATLDG